MVQSDNSEGQSDNDEVQSENDANDDNEGSGPQMKLIYELLRSQSKHDLGNWPTELGSLERIDIGASAEERIRSRYDTQIRENQE